MARLNLTKKNTKRFFDYAQQLGRDYLLKNARRRLGNDINSLPKDMTEKLMLTLPYRNLSKFYAVDQKRRAIYSDPMFKIRYYLKWGNEINNLMMQWVTSGYIEKVREWIHVVVLSQITQKNLLRTSVRMNDLDIVKLLMSSFKYDSLYLEEVSNSVDIEYEMMTLLRSFKKSRK